MLMKERLKKTVKIIIIAALLSGGYAFLCFRGFAIPCIFHEITGLRCPGCGVTHMCMDVVRLDFSSAFNDNQALFFMLPVLIILIGIMVIRYIKEGRFYSKKYETYIYIAMILVIIPFGILRNIFGF